MQLSKSMNTLYYYCIYNKHFAENTDFALSLASFSFTPDGPRTFPFSINIVDDSIFEGRENFTLGLRTSMLSVELSPAVTMVSIEDNEGKDIAL